MELLERKKEEKNDCSPSSLQHHGAHNVDINIRTAFKSHTPEIHENYDMHLMSVRDTQNLLPYAKPYEIFYFSNKSSSSSTSLSRTRAA